MNDEQLMRYSRHILLPQVDIEGQEKLSQSKVVIIGLGGLGSPVSMYLCAAGVGELVLCDYDLVDITNLQRQVLYSENNVGESKVDSAIKHLKQLNSDCKLNGISVAVTEDLLSHTSADVVDNDLIKHIQMANLVLDCTDNLKTRLSINEVCVNTKTPLVSGAAIRMEGQVVTFKNQGAGPCYQCLYSNPNEKQPSCSEAGVLSTTVGIIGTLQAHEALKALLGSDHNKDGELMLLDGMTNDFRKLQITKNPDCVVCSGE